MSVTHKLRSGIGAAFWTLVFVTCAVSQSQPQSTLAFGSGFKERAVEHVRHMASFGIHDAGSTQERRAAHYVGQEMKKAGLVVTMEPFDVQTFTLEDAVLETAIDKADIVKLAFNPYSATSPIKGDLVVVTTNVPRSVFNMNLDGKIVVVSDQNTFRIVSILKKPKAVISLSASDFDRLKAHGVGSAVIRFHGSVASAKSSNVVGTLAGKSGGREIIISAHYDSVRGPGANDNGSGVAAMLELARYFHTAQLPPSLSLRFVAFGAEEAGMLGSKAYLQRHLTELQSCILLFNIDEIGGNGALHVDTGEGVKGVPSKIENQLPADLMDKATNDLKDPSQRWRLLSAGDRTIWNSSNMPEWLRSAVFKARADLGHEIAEQNHTGSDHRIFIQAGVVATDIGSDGGAEVHAPTDVPAAVDADNVELATRLVLRVVDETLRSAETTQNHTSALR